MNDMTTIMEVPIDEAQPPFKYEQCALPPAVVEKGCELDEFHSLFDIIETVNTRKNRKCDTAERRRARAHELLCTQFLVTDTGNIWTRNDRLEDLVESHAYRILLTYAARALKNKLRKETRRVVGTTFYRDDYEHRDGEILDELPRRRNKEELPDIPEGATTRYWINNAHTKYNHIGEVEPSCDDFVFHCLFDLIESIQDNDKARLSGRKLRRQRAHDLLRAGYDLAVKDTAEDTVEKKLKFFGSDMYELLLTNTARALKGKSPEGARDVLGDAYYGDTYREREERAFEVIIHRNQLAAFRRKKNGNKARHIGCIGCADNATGLRLDPTANDNHILDVHGRNEHLLEDANDEIDLDRAFKRLRRFNKNASIYLGSNPAKRRKTAADFAAYLNPEVPLAKSLRDIAANPERFKSYSVDEWARLRLKFDEHLTNLAKDRYIEPYTDGNLFNDKGVSKRKDASMRKNNKETAHNVELSRVFADAFKDALEEEGLTEREASEILGVSTSTIYRVKSGDASIDLTVALLSKLGRVVTVQIHESEPY